MKKIVLMMVCMFILGLAANVFADKSAKIVINGLNGTASSSAVASGSGGNTKVPVVPVPTHSGGSN